MPTHRSGTREEWLAARLELLEAEKELTRRGDELARRRQELPWVRIDKAYRFETDDCCSCLNLPHLESPFVGVHSFFRYDSVVVGHEIDLTPDIDAMGVTSVAGLWTR